MRGERRGSAAAAVAAAATASCRPGAQTIRSKLVARHAPSVRSCPRWHRRRRAGWRRTAQSGCARKPLRGQSISHRSKLRQPALPPADRPPHAGQMGQSDPLVQARFHPQCTSRLHAAGVAAAAAAAADRRLHIAFAHRPSTIHAPTALAMFSGMVMMVAATPARKSACVAGTGGVPRFWGAPGAGRHTRSKAAAAVEGICWAAHGGHAGGHVCRSP